MRLAVTRLDRYLMGQLLALVTFGLVLFAIVWLAPETLFQVIQSWVAGKLPLSGVFELLWLNLPAVLEQSFPMAAMVAGVFLSRQMSQSFEWVACYTARISPMRVAMPILLSGLLITAAHVLVQEVITPRTTPALTQAYQHYKMEDPKRQNFVYLERNPEDPSRLEKFLLIGDVGQHELRDFFVLYYRPMGPQATVTPGAAASAPNSAASEGSQIHRIFRAKRGAWQTATRSWRLEDGVEYELDDEGVYKAIHPFAQQWVATSSYPVQLIEMQQADPASFPFFKLQRLVNILKDSHQTQELPYYLVRLQQKWSIPLASLILLPLGVLLGQEPPRARRTWGLTSAAVVLFVYLASMPFATNFGSLGLFAPWVAAWLPLTLAISVALGLYKGRQVLGL